MQAGKLRQRLHVQVPRLVTDEDGGNQSAFTTTQTVWGRVEPLRMSEQLIAQQTQARMTCRITLRYQAPFPPTYRLVMKGTTRAFEPAGVLNIDERNRELQLMAIETVVEPLR